MNQLVQQALIAVRFLGCLGSLLYVVPDMKDMAALFLGQSLKVVCKPAVKISDWLFTMSKNKKARHLIPDRSVFEIMSKFQSQDQNRHNVYVMSYCDRLWICL